ncbi:MAG TPA: hypothetical protein VN777_09480 [Terriglobales bacterium]|nr:hypothetical protein [Terriglobales bacterium]HZW92708.1 hypothetical protein [Candidatus Eremiobacteraceae bacterium]
MPEDMTSFYAEERREWEPNHSYDWLQSDPLLPALAGIEIGTQSAEGETLSFHYAWMRSPAQMRAQAFREREIAATLVKLLPEWRSSIPGLYSVGVGQRNVPEPRLVAVLTLDQPLSDGEWYDIRQRWARSARIRSRVPEFDRNRDESVPIVSDLRPAPTLLGRVQSGAFLLGNPDPPPAGAPIVQNGDRIGSESPIGIREFGTLTCIVSEAGSVEPLVLGSGHVLRQANFHLLSASGATVRVGKVKNVVRSDAAVATLDSPYLCDYRLKGLNLVPAAPILPTADLPVQMYGAKSGYQTGYLSKVNQIPANATSIGMFPLFTADIPCAHEDSGALLVTGRGTSPPVPAWQAQQMNAAYLDNITCAMLGMLNAGPPPGADPMLRPEAYFTPVLQVFSDLGVEAWVR